MRALMIAALGLTSLTAACAADQPAADDGSGTYNCATETRADTFTVGLEKQGAAGLLDFKLLTATPSPPARNDNTWLLQINAMAAGAVGSPATGATMTVTPFMPDHAHGTPTEVVITAMPDPGQYTLSKVNMWMPGLWETTITATASGVTDTVVYRFCIAN